MNAPARIRALSIHAKYACRHSGACCRAGWRIPVEPATEHAVSSLIATGALAHADGHAFERARSLTVTALNAKGACVFLEGGSGSTPYLCAIHRLAGREAKPVACRHFPRVVLHDGRGVSVSLSHFCPTAAELLFDDAVPLTIIEEPPAFPEDEAYDGLTATDALPPLIAPGMLMDLESYDAFERHMIAVLARSSSALAALDELAADVEHLRLWRPAQGALVDAVTEVRTKSRAAHGAGLTPQVRGKTAQGARHSSQSGTRDVPSIYAHLDRSCVARATPADLRPRAEHDSLPATHDVIRWNEWEPVISRYLAARAFASWIAYQGRGLRTILASLYVALDLVRYEAAALISANGRPLDRSIVKEAIRQADLQLMHHADSQRLADLLGAVEH